MTEVSERKVASARSARIPWVLRPWTLFTVNIVGFAVNWGAVVEEPYGYHTMLTCRDAAERADVLAVVLAALCVISGACVVLAVLWCRREHAQNGRWAPVLLTAAPLIAFALYNLWMAYITITVFLPIQVPCTGHQ